MATTELPKISLRSSDFSPGFLWGVASSAYQVEGAWDQGGRAPSIWDTFAHTPGRTLGGDHGDEAIDHYHLFRDDVALMAELGVNSYRFSISWSRLIPDGSGELNREGVSFYRELCETLIDHGITPAATLYHWDLPQALQDLGGWLEPESVDWFANYAAKAKEALGDLVKIWSTLNEPWCSAFLGYGAGEHAPGISDPGSAFVVAHHLMLAHHAAIAAQRVTNPDPEDQLGIVLNLIPAWPVSQSIEDRAAADGVDAIQNRLFLGAVFDGVYPDEVLEYHQRFDVADRIDLDNLARAVVPIDYLGVNYYNINHIGHLPGSGILAAWPGPIDATLVRPPGELTQMGWGVEPEGLSWILERVSRLHPGIPMMIMENGAAFADEIPAEGAIVDERRIDYLRDHIGAVHEARQNGADVVGYFVWSLMDNFEWAHGYSQLFGIVHVERTTMKRRVKASANWYRDFLSD